MSAPRHSFGQQPGRLVATMLRALAAELSDPGRYSRAKSYARDGAVIDISVRQGVVGGLVLGSRSDPYEVELVADAAPDHELERADTSRPVSMSLLIPGRDELAVSCTCPDTAGSLCKHAVAVLLVFADESSIEPELLARWRTADETSPTVSGVIRLARRGRATGFPDALRRPAALVDDPAPVRVDILADLLDGGELPELPDLAPHRHRPPPAVALLDPLTELVHRLTADALDTVRRQKL